ncbi:MAG: alternative ribosome rescue aminoacyl-tRNA hydrolase ArfB [Cyclobacteriaceae bacterium]
MHLLTKIADRFFDTEIQIKATRSSGPGGQNVNKVNSKISLSFDIPNSALLDDDEKTFLRQKLGSRLTDEGVLIIQSQETRSQLQNKTLAIHKFYEILDKISRPVKARRPTRPTKAAVKKRLQNKKAIAEKKINRRKPE